MLQLKNIKKDYKTAGTTVRALRGVSLRFRANEFVSVLGQSGCGKTTLLNIIGGLDHYTSGDLVICGVSTKDYKDHDWDVYRNHRIGFVFQSYNLIPHQTVLGNVELALTIAGVSKAERRKRAKEALEKVGLKSEIYKRPNQLSGGQMQRVAIARALVNNPEILLADEPTGALDTKTSIQIMELIREIAGERLVIMVTHNPELAEEYSSRIVRLQDGLVVSDSNPYDGAEDWKEAVVEEVQKSDVKAGATVLVKKNTKAKCPFCGAEIETEEGRKHYVCMKCHKPFRVERGTRFYKKQPTKAVAKKQKPNGKKKERSSMSYFTSLGLSARNLATKKGRTTITSVAGSIGIISVCLVLALSNGFNKYIAKTQEDMLSYNPVQITETTMDVNAIMSGMMSLEDMPDLSQIKDKVYVNSFLTNIAQGMQVSNNLSDEYLGYLADMPEEYYTAMQFSTGATIVDNLFTKAEISQSATDQTDVVETKNLSLSALKAAYVEKLGELDEEEDKQYAQLVPLVEYLGSVVNKMPGTSDFADDRFNQYVLSQYDVLAGEFPQNENEAVLVVGTNNDVTDLTLAQLGLMNEDEFFKTLFGTEEERKEPQFVDFDRIFAQEYTLFYNNATYTKNAMPMPYFFTHNSEKASLAVETDAATGRANGVSVRISAVLRLKEGRTYGCLASGLNLTEKLVDNYVAENMRSEISTWLNDEANKANLSRTASNLSTYVMQAMATGGDYTAMKRALGAVDTVNSISLYTESFETKEQMLSYLEEWNDTHEENEQVKYTDTVGMMMGMVETMLNAITYVLVAFTAISLIVSSVMIGIITYVSVVERTKEIGVLRSLGARKKDIKNLFNAETFIIGLSSGLFGVVVTYLLCMIVNAILGSLTGISTLASLPLLSALIMVCVSVVLALISGLIPAGAAARKDPVIALRTE